MAVIERVERKEISRALERASIEKAARIRIQTEEGEMADARAYRIAGPSGKTIEVFQFLKGPRWHFSGVSMKAGMTLLRQTLDEYRAGKTQRAGLARFRDLAVAQLRGHISRKGVEVLRALAVEWSKAGDHVTIPARHAGERMLQLVAEIDRLRKERRGLKKRRSGGKQG
jgi:predicted aminopeptidase